MAETAQCDVKQHSFLRYGTPTAPNDSGVGVYY